MTSIHMKPTSDDHNLKHSLWHEFEAAMNHSWENRLTLVSIEFQWDAGYIDDLSRTLREKTDIA